MVISGRSTARFIDANYAVLRKKRVNGQWKPASTNESWDLFWCEITELHPERDAVELAKTEGEHAIQEDADGEFIQITQEHRSLFASGKYETRLRPYIEDGTEVKPWMDGEQDG